MSFRDEWKAKRDEAHQNAVNKGFWEDHDRIVKVMSEHPDLKFAVESALISQKLKLIGDELAEAHDALRDGDLPSAKIMDFSSMEEELADVLIRMWDLEAKLGLDIAGAIEAKMKYNESRGFRHGRRF